MIIPDYGHGWMYEDPTLFVTVLIGFVLRWQCKSLKEKKYGTL